MKTSKYLLFLALILSNLGFGQSITLDPNTTTPAGVQVNSDLAFRKQKRETANGGWPNYPRDNSSVIIFEGGGTLSGITDGQDGLLVYVFNGHPTGPTATGQLIIQHENTSSLAINRIMTPNGLDFAVGSGGVALIYDGQKQRWRIASPAQTGGSTTTDWGITGNSGTNPATNFIGTTDSNDFTVRTNNIARLSINSSGNVGIGITSPNTKLDIAGDFSISSKLSLSGASTQNNLNRQGKSIIKIQGQTIITGIAGGTDGLIVHIYLLPGADLEIRPRSILSLPENQIIWSGNINAPSLVLLGGGSVSLIYDGPTGSGNWRILSVFKP